MSGGQERQGREEGDTWPQEAQPGLRTDPRAQVLSADPHSGITWEALEEKVNLRPGLRLRLNQEPGEEACPGRTETQPGPGGRWTQTQVHSAPASETCWWPRACTMSDVWTTFRRSRPPWPIWDQPGPLLSLWVKGEVTSMSKPLALRGTMGNGKNPVLLPPAHPLEKAPSRRQPAGQDACLGSAHACL